MKTGILRLFVFFALSLSLLAQAPENFKASLSVRDTVQKLITTVVARFRQEQAKFHGSTTGRPLATYEEYKKIGSLGDEAIPVLASYRNAASVDEQEVALRFLGSLDANKTLKPVSEFALTSDNSLIRHMATILVNRSDSEQATIFLERIAHEDKDEKVRELATRLMEKRKAH